MARYTKEAWVGKQLWVGIDVHRKNWHVTVLTDVDLCLFRNNIPGSWSSLKRVLNRFKGAGTISVVYEAGYSGFWLYDLLAAHGYPTIVVSPNKIPSAAGDKVKTNPIDSFHLADYLQKGILKAVNVPSPEERAHREVARRRRSFIQDRVRAQNQIKASLRFIGLELPRESQGRWSQAFVANLWRVQLEDPYQQQSFRNLLRKFEDISKLVKEQTDLLRDLSRSEKYARHVELLEGIPGVGWLTAIELILELRDMRRFPTAKSIGAYVGLTPSQKSSGEYVHLGRVTKQGRSSVRSLLVEASWRLVGKDPAIGEVYRRIAARSGSKRAIVAIARRLVIRMRRVLLDGVPYQLGVTA